MIKSFLGYLKDVAAVVCLLSIAFAAYRQGATPTPLPAPAPAPSPARKADPAVVALGDALGKAEVKALADAAKAGASGQWTTFRDAESIQAKAHDASYTSAQKPVLDELTRRFPDTSEPPTPEQATAYRAFLTDLATGIEGAAK